MEILFAILTVGAAIIYSELVGYFVHILLHSEKVKSLSRAHMLHHLRDYGPEKPIRTDQYIESTQNRKAFLGGIGMEWIIPIGVIVAATFSLLNLFAVPLVYQGIFIVVGITWGYIAFSYMHSAMHIKNFWMLRNRFFKKWFLYIRKMHDIHHNNVELDGRMMTNFGICYLGFDQLFGTYVKKASQQSREGFKAAQKRYSYIYK